MSMRMRLIPISLFVVLGCAKNTPDTATPAQPVGEATPAAAAEVTPAADPWEAILGGGHRSDDNKARDQFRHPVETLAFFGVEPTHTVVELSPGGGWYTEILAPYLKDQGTLIVTAKDPAGPADYYGTRQALAWQERQKTEAEVFGAAKTVVEPQEVVFGEDGKIEKLIPKPFDLAPEGTVDVVLTFRSSHGWYRRDAIGSVYGAAYKALKPGGVFGVVQHRAAEGGDPTKTAEQGYLPEETVISAAKAAGFELAERSEINANAKDTKDYEGGVWTLPPSLSKKEVDRDKYVAIGESDRMTLKFVKPAK